MIIRRLNWPLVVALAIIGPLLGAWAGTTLLSSSCPFGSNASQKATAPQQPRDEAHRTDDKLVLPDGDRLHLDELAPERATAIVVMKGPWCTVCQRQLQRLSRRLADVQAVDGAVFGLTTAPAAKNRALRHKLGLDFPILGDPGKSLHRQLDLLLPDRDHAIPGIIYLDEDGKVAKVHRGRYPGRNQTDCILETLDEISNAGR